MKFLDQENLGLQDGEGWRVRQWVSERFDGTANQTHTDSDEERFDMEQRAQSAPPPVHQVPEQASTEQTQPTSQDGKDNSSPTSEHSTATPNEPAFRFTAGMEASSPATYTTTEPSQSSPPIRVEVINNGSPATSSLSAAWDEEPNPGCHICCWD